MSQKRYTERELRLAERRAFQSGATFVLVDWEVGESGAAARLAAPSIATKMYPLPKIARPRVVTRPSGGGSVHFRFVDGRLQHSHAADPTKARYWFDTLKQVRPCGEGLIEESVLAAIEVYADLKANPMEFVEDDA
jgi:hypothetical protein